jgi:tyrosinase
MSGSPPRIVRTRKDVWTLGNAGDDLFWYQKAVGLLQSRPPTDPTSWRYLSAVHGYDPQSDPFAQSGDPLPSNADQQRFWNQCQHQTWFFLPWHRAYLACFEQIVAAAVVTLGGPPDWAVPYWNYSDTANPNARLLHPFFVGQTLADGSPNPLWVEGRNSTTGDFGIPDADVSLGALRDAPFTGAASGGDPGFGGPKTIFSHFGGTSGRLENVPHNQIHDDIGGLMGDPDTAALDPIFWLHHANIDRLWEVWTHRDPSFRDPTDPDWLASLSFEFHDASGTVLTFTPAQVVDPSQLLHGYQYGDISDPFAAAPRLAAEVAMTAGPPPHPELVGASAQAVVLDSPVTTAQVAFRPQVALAARARLAAARPARAYLNLENVTGTGRLAKYDVYIDVPPPGQETGGRQGLLAGGLSTFGVQKASRPGGPHGGSGITTVLDITDLVERLRREGRWDETRLHVTFVRRGGAGRQPPASNLRVGRVSVYYG